jgi:hypothetical protein
VANFYFSPRRRSFSKNEEGKEVRKFIPHRLACGKEVSSKSFLQLKERRAISLRDVRKWNSQIMRQGGGRPLALMSHLGILDDLINQIPFSRKAFDDIGVGRATVE